MQQLRCVKTLMNAMKVLRAAEMLSVLTYMAASAVYVLSDTEEMAFRVPVRTYCCYANFLLSGVNCKDDPERDLSACIVRVHNINL